MDSNVRYGFAAMSTDTGHISGTADGSWALNNPEAQTDWGYRAMHGSVVLGKQIVSAYYEHDISYSYYSGCSTGGRQGLKEVQMFPDDFDGVIAGAPAWWTTHLQTWTVKVGLYNLPTSSPGHIPVSLFPTIAAEVLRQCDPQDGITDGIISDPYGCDFIAEALLCNSSSSSNASSSSCLTAAQIGTLYDIYNDYVETNQTFVFPHLALGSEDQWAVLLGTDTTQSPNPLGTAWVADFLLSDPNWNYTDFSYQIVQEGDAVNPGMANANQTNLSAFHDKGGKLLHYHGLSDGLIPTGSSIYYYKEVLKTMTSQGVGLDDWYRFFLIPGMQHCAGSVHNAPWYIAGANQPFALGNEVYSVPGFMDPKHDALLALMQWTENGTAPESLIATKYTNDSAGEPVVRQRPLCPYPAQAVYTGTGDVNSAASWKCQGIS
jgi:feruloyl esterase